MAHQHLESNLFVKHPRNKKYMHSLTNDLVHYFQRNAEEDNLKIGWKQHPWPSPRIPHERKIIIHEVAGDKAYRYLNLSRYNADIAICFVTDLCEIGPEVAHLLYRRRADLLHVFIVTLEDLPERTTEKDVYKGLTAAPTHAQQAENGFYEPRLPKGADPFKTLNPEMDGVMSFHELKTITRGSKKVRDLLQYVFYQKNGTTTWYQEEKED